MIAVIKMDSGLTPRDMELDLMNIGYDEEYLNTIGDAAIERLYNEEFNK